MQTSKYIIVRGIVQGVFFRSSTKTQAEQLGVRGEVRNRPDGTVEIKAEGNEAAVMALIQWCHTGPPRSKVEEVMVEDAVYTGFQNFEVIRP